MATILVPIIIIIKKKNQFYETFWKLNWHIVCKRQVFKEHQNDAFWNYLLYSLWIEEIMYIIILKFLFKKYNGTCLEFYYIKV